MWGGIQISASYYNFITGNFIKNNRIGIIIENTSTSAYINNNELRTNGAGILIQSNSYANFIKNNMIENNIANYLDAAKSETDTNFISAGSGVIISSASNNIIQNNYFEQHFNNYQFHILYFDNFSFKIFIYFKWNRIVHKVNFNFRLVQKDYFW